MQQDFRKVKVWSHSGCLRTILRAEKLRMGSSAARETELSMMKTKMRLVKIWWLISLWQNIRNLQRNIKKIRWKESERASKSKWHKGRVSTVSLTPSLDFNFGLLHMLLWILDIIVFCYIEQIDWCVLLPFLLISPNLYETHGFVLLKMKKALPSGMGGVFSLMLSSDSLWRWGIEGTSGRSSFS